jgi:hypothetical protein
VKITDQVAADDEPADDEPAGDGDPAREREVAAPSELADATLPGVSDEDDTDEGGLASAAAIVSAEEDARGSAAAMAATTDEEGRASAAAMAGTTDEEGRASAAAMAASAAEEVRAAAAAAIADAGARANMARPVGPATAAALMEAIEISAAITMARAEGNTAVEPPARALPNWAEVVELQEVTAEAKLLGFRCRITMFPSVLESAELANVLLALRDALVGAGGSTGKARMFDVAFGLPPKPMPLAVRPYPSTAMLSFEVAGRAGPVEIACRLWYPASTLILRRADDLGIRGVTVTRSPWNDPDEAQLANPMETRIERELRAQLARLSRLHHPPLPALYIVDGPRRHRVTHDSFVIGRASKTADLVIKDGMISRKHAAVIYRDGRYYLKDLGSTQGIRFRGMLIDNKRIDEGDVFEIGEHELRFTYREEG